MPLKVAWHGDALQQLATTWLNTDDRDGVTMASRRIDLELAEQPLKKEPTSRRSVAFFTYRPVGSPL